VTINERKVDVTSWSKYYDSGTDFHSLFNICFNMLALGRKELCNAVKTVLGRNILFNLHLHFQQFNLNYFERHVDQN
jgi:hypothetical protein